MSRNAGPARDDVRIVSSWDMCQAEQEQLRARREQLGLYDRTRPPKQSATFGICCSGGGIRSATFNLGILQRLATLGFLPAIDYLSTVSGGGYIGSWLHGVIRNCGDGDPVKAKEFLEPPEQRPHNESAPEQDPILFLRKYSSYLAPDVGLFSADFWTILVIWNRNTFLNMLMIVPFLGAMSLLAMLAGLWWSGVSASGQTPTSIWPNCLAALIPAALAVFLAAAGVRGAASGAGADCSKSPDRGRLGRLMNRQSIVVLSALLFTITSVAVALLSATLNGAASHPLAELLQRRWLAIFAVFAALFLLLQHIGGFWKCSRELRRSPAWALTGLAYPFIAGAATVFLIRMLVWWMSTWTGGEPGTWHVIAWGPPLIAVAWLSGAAIHIGLMGADYWDYAREWLARLGAFLCIFEIAWAALFAIAVFGPWWTSWLTLHFGKTAAGLGGAWAATTVAGILAGNSDRTGNGEPKTKRASTLDMIARIAPIVFMVGFLMLVSFAAFSGIGALRNAAAQPAAFQQPLPTAADSLTLQVTARNASGAEATVVAPPPGDTVPSWLRWLEPIEADYWCVLNARENQHAVRSALGIFAACVGLVIIVPFFVNVNEFSMHHFYKNRLVRCYLGASRGKRRRPSGVTGFDPCDDFALSELTPGSKPPYLGPYPIVNATVNLSRGSELARKERQGESFIFTPLYCGFDPPSSPEDKHRGSDIAQHGYRSTTNYTSQSGPDIGTCMGISGAAVNPNHGYHTSATVAFLLTIFDVRLGWWLRNSRRKKAGEKPGPSYALLPLLSELFAQTDQRARWLNVSDGGQFENLGLYELVRRRCRYIIAGDGEQDLNYTFESLGGAVRKCRTDFGVQIDIDPGRIRPGKDLTSDTHCAIGRIVYPKDEEHGLPQETGWILYLKASITGDEPEDVAQYRTSNPEFPHQSTGNQFFTESQFESYRKLGWHVAQTAFENAPLRWKDRDNEPEYLQSVFECLYQQWSAPSSAASGTATSHADAYSKLMDRLVEPELSELAAQLFGWEHEISIVRYDFAKPEHRKIFFYCLELIQLMENVWNDLRFDRAADRNGPRHRGWMNTFRRWANQPAVIWTWNRANHTYNPLFRQFFISMQEEQNRRKEDVANIPCGPLPSPES